MVSAGTSVAGDQELTGIVGVVVDLMERLGAPGAGLAIAVENLFPPIPSELILPLAGFTASRGTFSLVEVIMWTTLGSVVGALAMYGLGARLGRDRMHALWARLPLVETRDLERCEDWFARHGTKAVLLGRMVPLFRSLVSVPAGIDRMSLPLFVALTTVGSALWNTLFVLAGWELGEQYHRVEQYAGWVQVGVLVLVGLALTRFVVRRVRRRRREA